MSKTLWVILILFLSPGRVCAYNGIYLVHVVDSCYISCHLDEDYNKQAMLRADIDHPHAIGRFIVFVKRYALAQGVIFGENNFGFFIYHSSAAEKSHLDLCQYENREDWKADLAKQGITGDIELLDPYAVARERPESEVKPWKYVYMRNLRGLSDEEWGNTFLFVMLLASFMVGLIVMHKVLRVVITICLGVLVGIPVNLFLWPIEDLACGALVTAIIFCPGIAVLISSFGHFLRSRSHGPIKFGQPRAK